MNPTPASSSPLSFLGSLLGSPRTLRRLGLALSLLPALLILLQPAPAVAQTTNWTWNGGGSSTNLNVNANWTNGTAPADSVNAFWVFGGTNAQGSLTLFNNFGAGRNVGGITFNAGAFAYIINGNMINLAGNITNSSTNLQTIGTVINLANTTTRVFTTASGGGNLLFNDVISGTGAIEFRGAGTTTFNAANTYSGISQFQAGSTLVLSNSLALQNSLLGYNSTAVRFGSGTTNYTIGVLFGSGNFNMTNTAGSALALTIGNDSAIGNVNPSGNYSANLSGTGATVTKAGTGVQTLSGSNSYTGVSRVNNGALNFLSLNSLYGGNTNSWTAANIIVASNATVGVGFNNFGSNNVFNLLATLSSATGNTTGLQAGAVFGFDTTGTNLTLSRNLSNSANGALGYAVLGTGTLELTGNNTYTGGTWIEGGTLLFKNTNNTLGTIVGGSSAGGTLLVGATGLTITNAIRVNTNSTLTLNNGGFQVTNTGLLSGSGTLTVAGAGTTTLNPGLGNTSTVGVFSQTNGTLVLTNGTLITTGTGNANNSGFQVSRGTAFINEGTTLLSGGGNINSEALIGREGSGTLTMNGGSWTHSGNINLGYGLNGRSSVLNMGGGTITARVINLGVGSSNNTLNLNGGLMVASNVLNIGANARSVINFNGGMIRAAMNANFFSPATSGGTITNNILAGGLVFDTAGFAVGISNNLLSGTANDGGLKLTNSTGNGVLTLSGRNSYNGKTIVNAGTLNFFNTNSLYGASNSLWTAANITVASNAAVAFGVTNFGSTAVTTLLTTLSGSAGTNGLQAGALFGFDTTGTNFAPVGILSNSVNGALGYAALGTGTLTLTNANTYSGGTRVNSGTLVISNKDALGSGQITLTGGTLNLGGLTTVTNTLGVVTGGTLTNGTITNTGGNYIFDNTGAVTVSAVLAGANGLIQNGTGTTTLSGVNTYSGGTTLNAGTLVINNDGYVNGSLGNGNSSSIFLRFASNATISSTANLNLNRTITISNNATANFIQNAGTTLNLVFTGVGGISGSGTLSQSGSGTLALNNNRNTYSGGTILNAGTLAVGFTGALGSGAVTFASNATVSGLANQTYITITNNYNIASGVTGTFTESAGPTLATTTLINSGTISGSGALAHTGTGTTILSGSNNYSGVTTVSGGTLEFLNTTSLYGGSNNLWTAPNIIVRSNATVAFGVGAYGTSSFSAENITTLLQNLTATTGNTNGLVGGSFFGLDVNGTNFTLTNALGSFTNAQGNLIGLSATAINGNGTLTIGANNNTINGLKGDAALNLGANNLTLSNTLSGLYSGVISGSGSLIKSGAGTQTLTAANTYSGGTVLNSGTLAISNNAALGSGTVTFASNATLGGLTNLSVANDISIATGATATFTESAGTTLTASGVISGNGALAQNGPGILTLSGNNSYQGTTLINGGVLDFFNTASLYGGDIGSWTAAKIIVASNATVAFGVTNFGNDNIQTLLSTLSSATGNTDGLKAGALFGFDTTGTNYSVTNNLGNSANGALGYAGIGSGTMTLSGTNTYTGTTAVGSGATVLLSGVLSNATGTMVISNNGTFSQSSSGIIAGSASLTVAGSGTTYLSGTNSYTGRTTVSGGIVDFQRTSSLYAGDTNFWTANNIIVQNGGGVAFGVGTNGDFTTSNITSLLSSLTRATGNTNGLIGGSSFGLDVTGTDFTLTNALGNFTNASGNRLGLAALGNGTLTLSGGSAYTFAALNGSAALALGTNNLALDNGANNLYTGTISLTATNTNTVTTGTFNKNGAGTLTLSPGQGKTNSFANLRIFGGTVAISSGVTTVTNPGVATTYGLVLNNSTMLVNGGSVIANGDVTLGSAYFEVTSGSFTTAGRILTGYSYDGHRDGAVNLGGTGTITALGGIELATGKLLGTLNLNGGTLNTLQFLNANGNAVVNFNGSMVNFTTNNATFIRNPERNWYLNVMAGGANFNLGGYNGTNYNVTLNGNLVNGYNGTGRDGGLTLTNSSTGGGGTLTLTGTNSYNGVTTINGGTLAIGAVNSIATNNAVVVNSRGTLQLNASQTLASLTGSGSVTLNNSGLIINVANGSNNIFSGNISGGSTFIALNGNANDFSLSGTEGTLTFSGSNSYTTTLGNVILGGTLVAGSSNAFGSTNNNFLHLAGTLDVGSFNVGVGDVSIGNGTITGSGTLTGRSFTSFNPQNSHMLISASLAGAGATFNHNSTGGTVVLSGSNSFSGVTTVNAGTLVLSNSFALGGSTFDSSGLASGGTLIFGTNSSAFTFGGLQGTDSLALTNELGEALALTVGGNNTNTTFSGALTDGGLGGIGGSLTKRGTGTLTLSGANSYTGTTTINGGTLALGTDASLSTNSAIAVNANLAFAGIDNQTQGVTFSTNISGTGTITQRGTGTTTLSPGIGNTNSIGSLLITAGTVEASSGSINITTSQSAGSANNGLGLYGGSLLINGANVRAINTITINNRSSLIVTNGSLTVTGLILNAYGANGSTITLAGSGTLNALGGIRPSQNALGTMNLDGGTLNTSFFDTGGNSRADIFLNGTVINPTAASGNFMNANTNILYKVMSNGAIFNLGGFNGTNYSITVAANLTNGYTNTEADGGLTLNASGTNANASLTLSGTNSYNGNTTIGTNATLVIGGAGSLGFGNYAGNISIAGTNSTFSFASTANQTFTGLISGNGTFFQSGAGTTTLNPGGNTNTVGRFIQTGGTVVLTNGTLITTDTRNATNSSFQVSRGTAFINEGTTLLSGGGNINSEALIGREGSGTLTMNGGSWTHSGNINLGYGLNSGRSSVLNMGGGTITARVINLGVGSSNNTLNLNGGLIIVNSLGNAQTASGVINFNGGMIRASTNTTSFIAVSTNANSTITNNILEGGLVFDTAGFAVRITNNLQSGTNGVADGGLSLTNSTGNGTLTLSGSNSYTGTTTINGGTLALGTGASLSTNSAIVVNGNMAFTGTNEQTQGVTFSTNISGTGTITKSGSGTLVLTAANTYSGGTTINGGTLLANHELALAGGNVSVNNGSTLLLTNINQTVGNVTLGNATISGSGTLTGTSYTATNSLNASISESLAGSGTLTMNGAGTLTLSGSNSSYSGGTLLNSGAINITTAKALGNGDLTMAGGNLGYNGLTSTSIDNQINVNSATATIANLTGNSANTLTLSGGINLNSNALTLSGGSFVAAGNISGTQGSLGLSNATATLSGVNTYGGTTTLLGGSTLNLGVANGISTLSAVTLGGGSDTSSQTNTLNLSGNNQSLASLNSTSGNSINQVVNTGTDLATLTLTGNSSFAGSLNGNLGLTVSAGSGGVVSLTGTTTSSYTGPTLVQSGSLNLGSGTTLTGASSVVVENGATLLLSGNNKINSSAPLTLDGGTLSMGGQGDGGNRASAQTFASLTLTANSTIDFSSLSGNSDLTFNTITMNGFELFVFNWSSTATSLFDSGPSSLSASDLARISFFSDSGTTFLGTGGFSGTEIVPVPEPGVIMAAALLLGWLLFANRRVLINLISRRRSA